MTKTRKIQLVVGSEATFGNMTFRVWKVEGRDVGVEIFRSGTRVDAATISRTATQSEMTVTTLRKKIGDQFEFLDGY